MRLFSAEVLTPFRANLLCALVIVGGAGLSQEGQVDGHG